MVALAALAVTLVAMRKTLRREGRTAMAHWRVLIHQEVHLYKRVGGCTARSDQWKGAGRTSEVLHSHSRSPSHLIFASKASNATYLSILGQRWSSSYSEISVQKWPTNFPTWLRTKIIWHSADLVSFLFYCAERNAFWVVCAELSQFGDKGSSDSCAWPFLGHWQCKIFRPQNMLL